MSDLAELTWPRFFSTWQLQPGWLAAAMVLLGCYLAAAPASSVRVWRMVAFAAGVVLMWVCVASAIGTYAMSLFWMHMVLHLMLIMVVPALLVLGHPLTVLAEARPRARRVLRSWPVTVLTHQLTGLALYTVVIIGTHLTGFMDQMAQHGWLMTAEQVLYVVTGYLFLLPILGEEPIRPSPPYLLRLGLLMAAMVPDTIVGIVLLQTDRVPFPVMMSMHPSWAPEPLADVHAAGGLMWAVGDGLMMAIGVGLMISVITSPGRRARLLGGWLEDVRRSTLAEHADVPAIDDPDGEEARAAYNRMLARLQERSDRVRPE